MKIFDEAAEAANKAIESINSINDSDKINPSHYKRNGVEAIDIIKLFLGDRVIDYCFGNILKYSFRYREKNGLEDLKKAKWYLDYIIKFYEENDELMSE